MSKRGSYIVIEGGEFAGKSTQLALLRQYIEAQGIKAVFTREPGGSAFGDLMRQVLFHPPEELSDRVALQLFTANRLHNYETVIKPALEAGHHVISDRNWYSTLCYQGARGQVSPDFIESVTTQALPAEYTEPAAAFVLTISATVRAARQRSTPLQDGAIDTFEARDNAYHAQVTKLYEDIVLHRLGGIHLDGSAPAGEIHEVIATHLKPLLIS